MEKMKNSKTFNIGDVSPRQKAPTSLTSTPSSSFSSSSSSSSSIVESSLFPDHIIPTHKVDEHERSIENNLGNPLTSHLSSSECVYQEHVMHMYLNSSHVPEATQYSENIAIGKDAPDIDRIRHSSNRSISAERSLSSERGGNDFEYALPQYAHVTKHVANRNNKYDKEVVHIQESGLEVREMKQEGNNDSHVTVNCANTTNANEDVESIISNSSNAGNVANEWKMFKNSDNASDKSQTEQSVEGIESVSTISGKCETKLTKAMQTLSQYTEYYEKKRKQEHSRVKHNMESKFCSESQDVEYKNQKTVNSATLPRNVCEIVVENGYILGRSLKTKKKSLETYTSADTTKNSGRNVSDSINENELANLSTTAESVNHAPNKVNNKTSFIREHEVNTKQSISALAVHKDFVAIGHVSGEIAVMQKPIMTSIQQNTLAKLFTSRQFFTRTASNTDRNDKNKGNAYNSQVLESKMLLQNGSKFVRPFETRINARVREHYEYLLSQRLYSPSFDPLENTEISPQITSLAFLPESLSPHTYLLTTSEIVPRLYKIIRLRQTAEPFKMVDKLDCNNTANLLVRNASSRSSQHINSSSSSSSSAALTHHRQTSSKKEQSLYSTEQEQEQEQQEQKQQLYEEEEEYREQQCEEIVTMKCVSSYAKMYDDYIHTICPLPFDEQFITCDKAGIKLWCLNYPDTALDVYNLTSSHEQVINSITTDVTDVIRNVRAFPHQPFLLFLSLASGFVRVLDTRQSLK